MKKFALSVAFGATLISSVAVAGTQRPTYLAFNAPAAASTTSSVVAPATPSVAKRDKSAGAMPLILPILGAVAVVGLVAAVATGGDSKDQSPG